LEGAACRDAEKVTEIQLTIHNEWLNSSDDETVKEKDAEL